MSCTVTAKVSTSTKAFRSNSLRQFNFAKVLGVNILGRQVPVRYKVQFRKNGGHHGIVFYNKSRTHDCFLYPDIQHSAVCQLKAGANLMYWRRKYLNQNVSEEESPYFDQLVEACNDAVLYDNGEFLGMRKRRYWSNGNVIYRAPSVHGNCSNSNCDFAIPDDGVADDAIAPKKVEVVRFQSKTNVTRVRCSSCGGGN